jgi:hypothetical protein
MAREKMATYVKGDRNILEEKEVTTENYYATFEEEQS